MTYKRILFPVRFWYENPSVFKTDQLNEIKQSSLARVICDNGDNIEEVTSNVFVLPSRQGGYLPCSAIPQMDLRFWTECSHGKMFTSALVASASDIVLFYY